jgi:hypothetical protein
MNGALNTLPRFEVAITYTANARLYFEDAADCRVI